VLWMCSSHMHTSSPHRKAAPTANALQQLVTSQYSVCIQKGSVEDVFLARTLVAARHEKYICNCSLSWSKTDIGCESLSDNEAPYTFCSLCVFILMIGAEHSKLIDKVCIYSLRKASNEEPNRREL